MNEKRMHLKDENCLIKEAKKQHSFLKPKTESINGPVSSSLKVQNQKNNTTRHENFQWGKVLCRGSIEYIERGHFPQSCYSKISHWSFFTESPLQFLLFFQF